jgi:hypothetical protein
MDKLKIIILIFDHIIDLNGSNIKEKQTDFFYKNKASF